MQTAQSRIAERMNWRTIAFVLENTVFLLIGLQAGWILDDVSESTLSAGPDRRGLRRRPGRGASCCGWPGCSPRATCWCGPAPTPAPGSRPPWTFTLILGWAGMRGVVTLAAAFLIPEDTAAPRGAAADRLHGRGGHAVHPGPVAADAGPPAARPVPDPMEDALARATLLQQASKAGLQGARGAWSTTTSRASSTLVKQRIEQRNFAAWERLGTQADAETPSELYARIRLAMLDAERRAGARGPRRGPGRQRGGQPRCWRCSTSRSR